MYINYVNNIPEYTVTQLNRSIKELLEEKFDYIKLIGESGPITIANSGHVYFSIKENDEVISCICLLYTSPSPRDRQKSRMPSSA